MCVGPQIVRVEGFPFKGSSCSSFLLFSLSNSNVSDTESLRRVNLVVAATEQVAGATSGAAATAARLCDDDLHWGQRVAAIDVAMAIASTSVFNGLSRGAGY